MNYTEIPTRNLFDLTAKAVSGTNASLTKAVLNTKAQYEDLPGNQLGMADHLGQTLQNLNDLQARVSALQPKPEGLQGMMTALLMKVSDEHDGWFRAIYGELDGGKRRTKRKTKKTRKQTRKTRKTNKKN
jgi:hypothetical protein